MSATARACVLAIGALAATPSYALPDDAAVKALLDQHIAQRRALGLAAVLYDIQCARRSSGPLQLARDVEFFYKAVDAQLTFSRAQDGHATGLVLHQNGRDIRARRIEQDGANER